MAVEYTHLLHRHHFSAWAAARAAQRGFKGATVGILASALESAGAPRELLMKLDTITSADDFDRLHRAACNDLITFLRTRCEEATYGRAAKLLATYLKAMVIIIAEDEAAASLHLHPPIDRTLLQAIARDKDLPPSLRQLCRGINWT